MHVPKEDRTSVPWPTGSSRALYSFGALFHPDFVKVVKDPVHPHRVVGKTLQSFPQLRYIPPFWSILSKAHHKEQTMILIH